MSEEFFTLIELDDGRKLICTPKGDQHYLLSLDGTKVHIDAQAAVKLYHETRTNRVREYAPAPASYEGGVLVRLPIERRDLEDASAFMLLRKRTKAENEKRFGKPFQELVRQHADRAENNLREEMARADPRDRTWGFRVRQILNCARAYRNRMQ